MTTATHEREISTTRPWWWLGTGAAVIGLTAFWAGLGALYGFLDVTLGLVMIGLMLVGLGMVVIGTQERRRAEDWGNWQEPAQNIAETNETVRRISMEIKGIATEIKALRASVTEALRELYATGYADGIDHAQSNGSATPLRLVPPHDRSTN